MFAFISLSFGPMDLVSASDNQDIQKALDEINKTNEKIEVKIEKAVKKADELQEDYLLEVRKIEEGDLFKLNNEKADILVELEKHKNDHEKRSKLEEKLQKIDMKLVEKQEKLNVQMREIELEIEANLASLSSDHQLNKEAIEKKLLQLNKKLSNTSEKHEKVTAKYVEDLDKVIADVYLETLEMSNKTIAEAAEKGVQAECSWKLVRFADKWVWIDPIRVVGC